MSAARGAGHGCRGAILLTVAGAVAVLGEEPPAAPEPDAAMSAMALFLYSLGPAPSPHPFDDTARRGQQVFEAEGCGDCHTPPAYTSNELIAVDRFEPPADAAARGLRVSIRRVRTDPGLALKTREGTGYYRLRDDDVPTGWRGPGVQRRAVPGAPLRSRSPGSGRGAVDRVPEDPVTTAPRAPRDERSGSTARTPRRRLRLFPDRPPLTEDPDRVEGP